MTFLYNVGRVVLFVDDTNLLIIQRNESVLHHKVNEVTMKLEYWIKKNNLMINVVKTVAISFHTKHNGFPIICKITFTNMDNAYRSESKFLAIHITKNLKWKAHVHSLSLKLNKASYLLKHLIKL
jgi:hypothetical protein